MSTTEPNTDLRYCPSCREELPLTKFRIRSKSNVCRSCWAKQGVSLVKAVSVLNVMQAVAHASRPRHPRNFQSFMERKTSDWAPTIKDIVK